MAKEPPKDEGRKYYTATVDVEGKRPGHPESRSVAFLAMNEQEVRGRLTAEGWKWKRITITEGRCIVDLPSRMDADAERYHAELENMLGHGFAPRYNSGPVARPYMPTPELNDAEARKSWAKHLEQWSHGLSVSALPQYLDVDMGGTVPLPARLVQDAERWPYCTAIVEAQVAQWRARRAHMAEHRKGDRSPEARELRKDDMEAVKSLDALKGWTFPALVESIGANPSPFDIPNPRLFHIPTGYMVPTMNPDHAHLKVEFWRHLLAAWDGPANTKGATVEQLLDHHHLHGGRAEVFRALVKSTAKRLHAIKDTGRKGAEYWETLADVLEQWLAKAPKVPKPEKGTTSAKGKPKPPTLADKLEQVPGAAERFMALVVRAGLCDASGAWIAGNDTKGKGRLIAMWAAIVEGLKVPGFDTDAALVAALKGHFNGLRGLDRLDRVRGRKLYTERVEEYIADLLETK